MKTASVDITFAYVRCWRSFICIRFPLVSISLSSPAATSSFAADAAQRVAASQPPNPNGPCSRSSRIERVSRLFRQACAESEVLHATSPLELIANRPPSSGIGASSSECLPAVRQTSLQLDQLAASRCGLGAQPAVEGDGLPVQNATTTYLQRGQSRNAHSDRPL